MVPVTVISHIQGSRPQQLAVQEHAYRRGARAVPVYGCRSGDVLDFRGSGKGMGLAASDIPLGILAEVADRCEQWLASARTGTTVRIDRVAITSAALQKLRFITASFLFVFWVPKLASYARDGRNVLRNS
jgi:hypothetical protein